MARFFACREEFARVAGTLMAEPLAPVVPASQLFIANLLAAPRLAAPHHLGLLCTVAGCHLLDWAGSALAGVALLIAVVLPAVQKLATSLATAPLVGS